MCRKTDNMADDGMTGPDEMLKLLMHTMEQCEESLEVAIKPTDEKGNVLAKYCKGEWDNLICWPNSPPGTISIKCPDYIYDFNHDAYARRHCDANGTWRVYSSNPNKVWNDYLQCIPENLRSAENIEAEIRTGGISPRIKSMIQLYTVGYSFSLVALTFAMMILTYFQRLHCTRNYIHMHLFASFILRAIAIFVKDKVLFIGAGILDVQSQPEAGLQGLISQMQQSSGGDTYKVGCKVVMTLFHYFVATNYYWILVEALYLHSLIFVAFFSDKKYLWRFTLTGWGVPVLFVVPWAIVRGTLEDTHCWDIAITEYKWIYNGPIVVANVINFLLFLNIIRVLWYKMRERGVINRSNNRQQYRKLAKSTLVLIPMFGVHAIVFIGMPDTVSSGVLWEIRMYFDLFFNSFQGFFVAIIYCFCNGEVQAEFKKAWERFNLSVEMQRGTRDRSRSSVTMLTSFNSSGSQQARLSIAGQVNRKNSNNGRHHQPGNNNTTQPKKIGSDHASNDFTSILLIEKKKGEGITKNRSEGTIANGQEVALLSRSESEIEKTSADEKLNKIQAICLTEKTDDDVLEKEFEGILDNVILTTELEANCGEKASTGDGTAGRDENSIGNGDVASAVENDPGNCI